jgi:hypothetical protein
MLLILYQSETRDRLAESFVKSIIPNLNSFYKWRYWLDITNSFESFIIVLDYFSSLYRLLSAPGREYVDWLGVQNVSKQDLGINGIFWRLKSLLIMISVIFIKFTE